MIDTEVVPGTPTAATPLHFTLPPGLAPGRLDKALAQLMPDHSRARLQAWIAAGHVQVDGERAQRRTRVQAGSHICVFPQPAPEALAFVPEPIDFTVLAEGEGWVVVDKPAGLVTHPGAGHWHGTLMNGLLYRYPELAQVTRAGIVHRLDKDTSGLLVVARTEAAQVNLVRQLKARTVRREYRALVHGWVHDDGCVDAPIGRDPHVPVRMTSKHPIAPKRAVTHYEVRALGQCDGEPVSELTCRLETGRTHQIRVHMAALHHPLLGDTLYGGKALAGAQRQMLHACALGFQDPLQRGGRYFEVSLAEDFRAVRARIVWDGQVA